MESLLIRVTRVVCAKVRVGINLVMLFMMQPQGFFNCSPAIDVPPSAGDLDDKEIGKPIQNELIAKL